MYLGLIYRVEKWAAVARDKAAEDSKPDAEQQARVQQMMNTAGARAPQLAIGDGTGTVAAAKKFYPMLMPRTNVKLKDKTSKHFQYGVCFSVDLIKGQIQLGSAWEWHVRMAVICVFFSEYYAVPL